MPQKADPSISSIALSEVIAQERIDSEYFQPEFLEVATQLRSAEHKRLGNLSTIVTSAFYPAATDLYEHGDVPFIRGVDVINYPVITNDQPFERIPLSFIRESKGIQELHAGDIVITKVGTPCYAGILHENLKHCALSRTVLGLKDINTEVVDPYYLVVFLRCKYGFFQLMREREQQIQLQLTLDRVSRINVFLPEKAVQVEIGNILREYHQQTVLSQDLYRQVEQLLLDELGLSDLDVPDGLHSEATLNEAWTAARIDSEYFQTRYRKLDRALQRSAQQHNFRLAQIKEFSAPLKYGTSEKFDYLEKGIPFLRITDLQGYFFEPDSLTFISPSVVDSLGDAKVRTGDVIISRTGTLGVAVAIPEALSGSVFGSYFIRSKPDSNIVLPSYLALYLNSPLGQIQAQRLNTGAIQTNLTIPAIENLKVIVPDKGLQEEAAKTVDESIKVREYARGLLKQATHKVEALIEGEAVHG